MSGCARASSISWTWCDYFARMGLRLPDKLGTFYSSITAITQHQLPTGHKSAKNKTSVFKLATTSGMANLNDNINNTAIGTRKFSKEYRVFQPSIHHHLLNACAQLPAMPYTVRNTWTTKEHQIGQWRPSRKMGSAKKRKDRWSFGRSESRRKQNISEAALGAFSV